MSCEGGCIAGPSVITDIKASASQLKKYVDAASAVPVAADVPAAGDAS
jgi:hypothetical protein